MPLPLVLPLRNGASLWGVVAAPIRPPATGVPAIVARPPAPLPIWPSSSEPPATPVGRGATPTVVPVQGALPPPGNAFSDPGPAAAAAPSVLSTTGPAGVPVWAWVAIIVLVFLLVR